MCVAWYFLLFFPWTMAFADLDAACPDGHDWPPSQHQFRTDWLIRDAGIGALLTAGLGVLTAWMIAQYGGQIQPPATIPEAGPFWSERHRQAHADRVQSHRDQFSEN